MMIGLRHLAVFALAAAAAGVARGSPSPLLGDVLGGGGAAGGAAGGGAFPFVVSLSSFK